MDLTAPPQYADTAPDPVGESYVTVTTRRSAGRSDGPEEGARPMGEAMDSLEVRHQQIERAISQILDRLAPILNPAEAPVDPRVATPRQSSGPLVDKLYQLGDHLENLTQVLDRYRNRLDV